MVDMSQKAQRMRRKIIAAAYQLGWYTVKECATGDMVKQCDMARINAFCRTRATVKHDTLNAYTLAELPVLVSQFGQLLKSKS